MGACNPILVWLKFLIYILLYFKTVSVNWLGPQLHVVTSPSEISQTATLVSWGCCDFFFVAPFLQVGRAFRSLGRKTAWSWAAASSQETRAGMGFPQTSTVYKLTISHQDWCTNKWYVHACVSYVYMCTIALMFPSCSRNMTPVQWTPPVSSGIWEQTEEGVGLLRRQ